MGDETAGADPKVYLERRMSFLGLRARTRRGRDEEAWGRLIDGVTVRPRVKFHQIPYMAGGTGVLV